MDVLACLKGRPANLATREATTILQKRFSVHENVPAGCGIADVRITRCCGLLQAAELIGELTELVANVSVRYTR
jgi:hypothetical protein